MKKCTLDDFLAELNPWLDRDHIRKVLLEGEDQLVVVFLDGMKNVYQIDDCSRERVHAALADIRDLGIPVELIV